MMSSDDERDRAAKLRAQAKRYRLLAESLADLKMIAVAQDCARELESEALAQEQFWKVPKVA